MREPKGSSRPTLADVAREAGISIQTASHVLTNNKTARVAEETRQRVMEAAQKIGYRPNRLAQAMQRGKTNVIGIWIPVNRPILTYMWFLQAISTVARRDGYELMITCLDADMAYAAEGKAPHQWPVDGILAIDAGKAIRTFREDPANDEVPVAILGFEEYSNCDSVGWDVAGAAREATERLIAKGCKSIVHVTLDWVIENYPREQRRRGYTEAMEAAGLKPTFVISSGEGSSAAAKAMASYLAENPVPDAVFGFTDTLVIGACRAIFQKGYEVPKDCLAWGFADFPEAENYRVPLSSIRAPIEELVEQGWSWLMERIGDPTIAPRMKVLPMRIIERESTTRD